MQTPFLFHVIRVKVYNNFYFYMKEIKNALLNTKIIHVILGYIELKYAYSTKEAVLCKFSKSPYLWKINREDWRI